VVTGSWRVQGLGSSQEFPEGVPSRRNSAPNTYQQFTKSVAKTEQPFGRVNSIFASAVARQRDITANAFELDESVIQTGFQFRGECFSLRLGWAILWDFDTIYSNNTIDSRIRSALRSAVATRIKGLMGRCLSLIILVEMPNSTTELAFARELLSESMEIGVVDPHIHFCCGIWHFD